MSLTVELGISTKESAAQVVSGVAIKVYTVRNTVVHYRCVLRESLNMEESVGECLFVLEQSISPLELEVSNDFRGNLSAEVKVGDDTK